MCSMCLRIGYPFSLRRVLEFRKTGKFSAAALPNQFRKSRLKVAEEREWLTGAKLLSHKDHRNLWE